MVEKLLQPKNHNKDEFHRPISASYAFMNPLEAKQSFQANPTMPQYVSANQNDDLVRDRGVFGYSTLPLQPDLRLGIQEGGNMAGQTKMMSHTMQQPISMGKHVTERLDFLYDHDLDKKGLFSYLK
jgi:hypothetical protein